MMMKKNVKISFYSVVGYPMVERLLVTSIPVEITYSLVNEEEQAKENLKKRRKENISVYFFYLFFLDQGFFFFFVELISEFLEERFSNDPSK